MLIHGDCLQAMKDIEAGSVDMILADLPYGTTYAAWDSIIPFEPLWEQYKRVIKKNGAVVLFGSQPFTSNLIVSNMAWFKYEWIWHKGRASGHVHAKNKPMKAHENILVFSGGTTVHVGQSISRMNYNPQISEGKGYKRIVGKGNQGKLNHKASAGDIAYIGTMVENLGTRYPRSVIDFKSHNVGNHHPTQKPVALLEYLIKTYTNEGELVMDNVMGSGSTGVAARNLNRRFLGIEKDLDYFNIAKNRIESMV